MRNEQLKYFTAILTVITAAVTFYVFAERKGIFFLTENTAVIASIFISAYAAFLSLYLTRRIEKRRMSKRIFIIYSHKDKEAARKLTAELRKMGYNPWLDEEEIIPGQNWNKAINQAIENSSAALFLASQNTLEEGSFVLSEIKAAREVLRVERDVHSPVIPVMLEESELPKELASIHAVKLFDEQGMEQLKKGLKHLLDNGA